MKNSNDVIGNGTRDLPACSAVPQPTARPRTHFHVVPMLNMSTMCVDVITHITLFVIVYCLAASFDLEYKASSGPLYKEINVTYKDYVWAALYLHAPKMLS